MKVSEGLERIIEYLNCDVNEAAMNDALNHIMDVAQTILPIAEGIETELQQAKETIRRSRKKEREMKDNSYGIELCKAVHSASQDRASGCESTELERIIHDANEFTANMYSLWDRLVRLQHRLLLPQPTEVQDADTKIPDFNKESGLIANVCYEQSRQREVLERIGKVIAELEKLI